jgi:CIC family chloride channel protein
MGAYTPAAIAPVVAASLSAAVAARALGATPYLITVAGTHDIHTGTYFLSAGLGILCALIGIALMRLVTLVETQLRRLPVSDALRPALGGFLLIPVVFYAPQALSGGHGALHLTFISEFSLGWLIAIAAAKLLGIVLSLGFGFRGGLFFASLVLGGLLGEIFAHLLAFIPGPALLSVNDAALIGMAAMTATVVGGPMTMSLLILEVTHDFEITATVLTAALCATTLVRERFGYSFSTWRLHLRGEVIKSARDIGWARSLTAGRMMRQAPATASTGLTIAGFRELFPLGSTTRVLLEDDTGRYAGIVPTAAAYADTGDEARPVSELRILEDATLTPEMDIAQVMRRFDDSAADDMAVVDRRGNILGILTEKYVRKRYADELDKAQRELFGET